MKNTDDAAEKTKIKNDIKSLQTDIKKSINTLQKSIGDMRVKFGLPKFSDVQRPGAKETFKKFLREQYYNPARSTERIIKKSDLAKGRVPSTLGFLRENPSANLQFIKGTNPEDTVFNKIISARPITDKLIRSPFDEGGGMMFLE